MIEFLTILYECMGHRCLSTFAVCRLFNRKNRSEQRQRLREAWAALNVGEPTLNSVERVLKSGHSTIVRTASGPYAIRPVLAAYRGRKTIWMFDLPNTGQVPFLRALRARFAGRELLIDDAYALLQEDRELDDLATTAGKLRLDPLTKTEFVALLRCCLMVRVDGYVLTRRSSRYWLFVGVNKKV